MASGLTGTYLFPYPLQTDPVDVAADVQALAQGIETTMLLKAPLNSPTFTGVPLSTTPADADNSTKIATTAFVKNQAYLTVTSAATTFAPIASPTFTGVVTLPSETFIGASAGYGRLKNTDAYHSILLNGTTGSSITAAVTPGANISEFIEYGGTWHFKQITGAANTTILTVTPTASTFAGTIVAPASTTTRASLRVPHGAAPTSPTNGDVWTTTVGMYAYVNGATVGPFGTGATYTGSAPTAITGALWANSNYNSLSVYTGSRWASMTGTPPATKSATYTLALGDEGSILVMAGATTNNITVPTNATVAFPVGSSIMVVQTSTVQTVISGAGVTFVATPGLKLRAQNSVATLLKIATDTWVVTGDTTA